MKEKILEFMLEAAETTGALLEEGLTDNSILLESGLDSLAFAILVSLLDEELGFDPFAELSDPVYPVTLGEFVDIYVNHQGVC